MTLEPKQTILVVEDKEPVRSVLLEILVDLGYTVLEASDGAHALELARAHDGPIHLLLADIVMPGMQGDEVARRLRTIRPETKILFMSGYTKRAVADSLVAESGAAFIPKPFSLPELTEKLRSILGARTALADRPPEPLASP
jgi:two-component system, cell cycle sensor histidine kinase and response regulator CckA